MLDGLSKGQPMKPPLFLPPCLLAIACTGTAQTLAPQPLTERQVVETSRTLGVRILIDGKTPAGSGFFIDNQTVVTCFHVVARTWFAKLDKGVVQELSVDLASDIRVLSVDGQELAAEVVSMPTKESAEPMVFDFAILRLKKPVVGKLPQVRFYQEGAPLHVGDPILFSGYPLDSTLMLTHKGSLAGISAPDGILGLQAPVNKGVSGSALLAADGTILGIVSMRLGGIGKGLFELRQQIDAGASSGSVRLMGVDPLQATKGVIDTLDLNISTGIGYARSTIYLEKYRRGPK